MTRVAIIGAGAIGSALGALLGRAGQDVTLIGRADHVAAIRQAGLQADGPMGAFTAKVAAAETLEFRPDIALLTVKTQDVVAALETNLANLTDVPVITLQNGVRADELAATVLPKSQILSAVVFLHVNYLTPGRVTIMSPGWLVVGRPFGANDARVEAAVRLLKLAVPTHMSANVHGAHWLKLIVNLNNALPALTDCTVHQVFADDYLRRLGVQLMREGLRVAARAGVRLESLPDVSVWLARLLGWLPLGLAAGLAAAKASRMQTAWPLLGSTLQSLRRRRPTEIDYLNGEVVRLGRQVGEPTPLNAAVVRLVHQVEQTGTFLTAEEIRRAVGTA